MADVVLIHGAWQGSWVWRAITPILSAAGHRCIAVDLPGSAPDCPDRATVKFSDQIDHLKTVLHTVDCPAIVVGHSGGGLAASQIAEEMPDHVAGLVYVAGMMLPSGTRFAEVAESVRRENPAAAGIWPFLEHLEGMSAVPPEAAIEIFYQDCDPQDATVAAAQLTPQSNAARDVAPKTSEARFGTVPRVYIEALKDRSVIPAVQRRMQQLVPGAAVSRIDTGHAPMLADPSRLAYLLLQSFDRFAR